MKPIESLFHIHSFGYAAENKALDTLFLEVYPVETLSYVDGELVSFKEKVEDEGEDAEGNKYKVEALTANSIKCLWMPFGSNRRTAPDVRRGERILIWKYGDADCYYWSICGLDDVLRRLETVVYAFSNTKDESVKELTPDNSYWFQISTHLKLITLGTSTSDGEPFAYTIQLNTKEGLFIITDDKGNYIELESARNYIHVENADGSTYTLEGNDIKTFSKSTISHKTETFSIEADTVNVTSKNTNMVATVKHSVNSPMISENGS